MRITQGTFSYLPNLTDEEIEAQIRYSLGNGWAIMLEYTDDPHPRNFLWEMWKQPDFDLGPDDAGEAMQEVAAVREAYPNHYIKLVAYDASLGRQTSRLSFIINRPEQEPGYRILRTEKADRQIRYTLVPYAYDEATGRRYGNEGSLSVERDSSAVQEGIPGPDSPAFQPDGGGSPAPERDPGAGES